MAGIAEAGLTTLSIANVISVVYPSEFQPRYATVTTLYSIDTACERHWLQRYPGSITSGANVYLGAARREYFYGCYSNSKNTFSPGVCPSNYYVAAITEFADIPGTVEERYWAAYCCGRRVLLSVARLSLIWLER
jgi:hypothetical protein